MLSLKFSVLTGAFGGSGVAIHSIDGIIWERSAMLGGVGGGVLAMGLENPFNVAFRGEDNAVIKLLDVKPVEVSEETQILKRGFRLVGQLQSLANNIVDLLGSGLVGTG